MNENVTLLKVKSNTTFDSHPWGIEIEISEVAVAKYWYATQEERDKAHDNIDKQTDHWFESSVNVARVMTLIADGFDRVWFDDNEQTIAVRCSQCVAAVIQGVACHETGCPNSPRPVRVDYDENWEPFDDTEDQDESETL